VYSVILGHFSDHPDHAAQPWPRRSTRSATAEPERKPNSTVPKWKRSQAPAVEILAKETKPSESRLSVGPSLKGRTSTRPRASLKEVEEVEDDVKEESPVKESRPSPKIEDSEDDDVYAEEEGIKLKGRKSISMRKGRGKASDDWDRN
jgi:hypothetical protein